MREKAPGGGLKREGEHHSLAPSHLLDGRLRGRSDVSRVFATREGGRGDVLEAADGHDG